MAIAFHTFIQDAQRWKSANGKEKKQGHRHLVLRDSSIKQRNQHNDIYNYTREVKVRPAMHRMKYMYK